MKFFCMVVISKRVGAGLKIEFRKCDTNLLGRRILIRELPKRIGSLVIATPKMDNDTIFMFQYDSCPISCTFPRDGRGVGQAV